jgi:hypothetical protein
VAELKGSKQTAADSAMAMIRITTSDHLAQMLHSQAVRENRTVSKMGKIILRQGLEERRLANASTQQIVRILRGETGESAAQ